MKRTACSALKFRQRSLVRGEFINARTSAAITIRRRRFPLAVTLCGGDLVGFGRDHKRFRVLELLETIFPSSWLREPLAPMKSYLVQFVNLILW